MPRRASAPGPKNAPPSNAASSLNGSGVAGTSAAPSVNFSIVQPVPSSTAHLHDAPITQLCDSSIMPSTSFSVGGFNGPTIAQYASGVFRDASSAQSPDSRTVVSVGDSMTPPLSIGFTQPFTQSAAPVTDVPNDTIVAPLIGATMELPRSSGIAPPLSSRIVPLSASSASPIRVRPSLEEHVAPARSAPAPKRVKRKGKAMSKGKQPRLKWTNDMVSALLAIRFEKEGDVKTKIESADTNVKKALAWQYFASVLSEKLSIVISSEQLTTKYRKMKCEYRKRKRDIHATGNNPLEPMDEAYWSILNDGFGRHAGISGDIMFDTNTDVPADESGSEVEETAMAKEEKRPPLVQLATAIQTGMEAIATAMASSSASSGKIESLIETLSTQHSETIRVQQQQIELLKLLAQKLEK